MDEAAVLTAMYLGFNTVFMSGAFRFVFRSPPMTRNAVKNVVHFILLALALFNSITWKCFTNKHLSSNTPINLYY